jgi:protein-S-isoprenylcysteine O-methyltransferase Ste14
MAQQATHDNAGVIAPPPLISLAALLVGLALDRLAPIGFIEASLSRTVRLVLAVLVGALAIWVAARGIMAFRRHGTAVDPRRPVSALVTSGIFASTRNPLYQSQGLLLLALAIAFASDWAVLSIVPWAVAMHVGVVQREERYLERRFGDDYRRYVARVPRYGWPL